MKRLYILYIVGACLTLLGIAEAKAQYTISAEAPTISELKPLSNFRSATKEGKVLVLEPLKTDELRSAKAKDKASDFRVFRFAVNRPLKLNMKELGAWSQAQDGSYVWTFSIQSPKAISTSVLFEDYHLPKGAKLFVYGQEGLRDRALSQINNSASGILQIAPKLGDKLHFIYQAPQGDKSRDLPFRITRLSHGFRSLRSFDTRKIYDCDEGEPYFNFRFNTLPRIACADNVIKHEKEDLQARSVVLLITDGSVSSTATLINNKRNDGTPYILTASHCVNGVFSYPNDIARVRKSVASAVFFFGFESPIPNGNIRGSEEKTLSGADLIAYNTDCDMTLLKLTGLPEDNEGKRAIPASYNPYFSAWNISPNPKGEFFNIHHPVASTKRFNLSKDKTLDLVPTYKVSGLEFINTHWRIKEWTIGTTATGSSGSPLFDEKGYVIGALTGGQSDCGSAYTDSFFALSQAWDRGGKGQSLQPWLDPDKSGAMSCEGYDPNKKDKIYRLSEFYGKEQVLNAYMGDDNAIARYLEVKGAEDVELIGSYIVFKGSESLQKKFPEHILELLPITKQGIGKAVWSVEVQAPVYQYYNKTTEKFSSNERTILADTIEVFLPKPSTMIKAGAYLLSLKPKQANQKVSLPILMSNDRSKAMSSTYHQHNGSWDKITKDAIWLDLLFKSSSPITLGRVEQIPTDLWFYYSKGKLICYAQDLAKSSQGLEVYDLSGNLCLQVKKLTLGQNVVDVSSLLKNQVYVAVLRVGGVCKTLKFIH